VPVMALDGQPYNGKRHGAGGGFLATPRLADWLCCEPGGLASRPGRDCTAAAAASRAGRWYSGERAPTQAWMDVIQPHRRRVDFYSGPGDGPGLMEWWPER